MEEKKKQEKLSYEELENAAQQLSVQAEALYKENMELRKALEQANMANAYTQLEFRFKVLQYAEHFSFDFVDSTVKAIEEIMSERKEEPKEE